MRHGRMYEVLDILFWASMVLGVVAVYATDGVSGLMSIAIGVGIGVGIMRELFGRGGER